MTELQAQVIATQAKEIVELKAQLEDMTNGDRFDSARSWRENYLAAVEVGNEYASKLRSLESAARLDLEWLYKVDGVASVIVARGFDSFGKDELRTISTEARAKAFDLAESIESLDK